jgi:hypothetical protein
MADGNPGGAGGGGGPRKRSFADTLKTFTKTKKKQKKRQQQADPTGFLLLACRFKNERHIWYEYIHHYFAEGVDHILLIDDNSDDEFVEYNSWLDSLIDERKVTIKRPLTGSQTGDYQAVMPFMKKFEWLLVVDADEFVFCPQPDKSLKQILQTKYAEVDQIRLRWRLFTHHARLQPKSVIADNLWTHTTDWDTSSPNSEGYKCLAKTALLEHVDVHFMTFSKADVRTVELKDCHNQAIVNNHYRTQSEEFLRGVKEKKGGGVNKNKYQNFRRHLDFEYKKQCLLLKEKRLDLIAKLEQREQVRPRIHPDSSFAQERGSGEAAESSSSSSSSSATSASASSSSESMAGHIDSKSDAKKKKVTADDMKPQPDTEDSSP